MALITYDGSAQDHEVIPQVLKTDKSGKPQKRRVAVAARTIRKPIDEYVLREYRFPKGQPLSVTEKDLVRKAAALGCFKVEIIEGEPATFDKKWLEKAIEEQRVTLSKAALQEAPAPAKTEKPAHAIAADAYDKLKRSELMRMASTRGLKIHPGLKKDDLQAMLREQEAAASAEDPGDEYANYQDVG